MGDVFGLIKKSSLKGNVESKLDFNSKKQRYWWTGWNKLNRSAGSVGRILFLFKIELPCINLTH